MFYELNVGKVSVAATPTDPSKKSEISGTVNTISTDTKRVVLLDRELLTLQGSCIVNDDNSWKVTGYFSTDSGLIALCFDESGEFNADVYDQLSMCTVVYTHGTEWTSAIEPTTKNNGSIFSNSVYTGKTSWDYSVTIEDIKSSIAKFQFDTIGVSGHFEDSSDTPVTIGDGNTVPKVGVGSLINIEGDITEVTSVTDDGEGSNEVVIDSVYNGQSYTYDIYGDGSCVFFAPLDRDPETENTSNVYQTRNLLWESGKFSKSLAISSPFQAKDGGIVYPNFKLADGEYTFSFWMCPKAPNSWIALCQNNSFGIYYSSGFRVSINRSVSASTLTTHTYAPSPALVSGTWYHFVVSIGTAGCTIWKDNVQVFNSATNSYMLSRVDKENYKENRLSLLCNDGWGNLSSIAETTNNNIKMSHVRIFNKKITLLADVTTLYNEVPSNGGLRTVTSIVDINTNLCQMPMVYNKFSTVLIEPKVKIIPFLKGESITSVEPLIQEEGKFQVGFIKGSSKIKWHFSSNDTASALYGFGDNAVAGGYYWGFIMFLDDLNKKNYYFTMQFPKEYRLIGMSFKRATTYELPLKFLIYSSESGAFRGEEKFCGEEVFADDKTLVAEAHSAMFKFRNLIVGKYIRFYITSRSEIVNNLSVPQSYVGFQNVYFEVAVPVPVESRKARSIVIDVADCWGSTTYMGARAFCPMLNGEFVSMDGWIFYQTSYEVVTSKADRCFDPKYSFRDADTVGTYWRTASGQYTNQRIIAVAPKDFYFDDIFFLNYHSAGWERATYGVKNIKIRSTLSVISDTTYNAAIAGEETVFIGQVPKMYTNTTELTNILPAGFCLFPRDFPPGLLGDKRKSVKVRSLAFDFPSSYGSTGNLGVRRIEFWNKGVRYYQNAGGTWTYGATSTVSGGNASYAFACNGALHDSTLTTSWLSVAGQYTNQRLTILFPVEIEIDAIRISNYTYSSGVGTDKGVVGVTVMASLDSSSPSTTYNTAWAGSYELVPYTNLPKRLWYDGNLWSVLPIIPKKNDTWLARSVVFDIHNNYGGSFTGIHTLRFLLKNLTMMYKVGWAVYESSAELGYTTLDAIQGITNWQTGCVSGAAWKTLLPTSRIVVVFDTVSEFDTIDISNWWDWTDYIGSVLNGINKVTISITNSVLGAGDAIYNQTVTGGAVIFNGGVPARNAYSSNNEEYYTTMCTKNQENYYSTDIGLLVHSDTTNGSTTFTDSSNLAHSLAAIGTITHSTAQQKIGATSIVTTNGYLYSNTFQKHHVEARGFEIGMWIYPTAVAGDKGLISKWMTTGNKRAFCLSVNAGKLEFKYSSDGTVVTTCTSIADIPVDAWTWVGVKRNGSSLYLIINGVVDSTFTIGTSTIFHSNYRLEIGSFNGDVANCFAGYLDEILVKLDGLQNNSSFTPVTSSISVTPSWSAISVKGYFCFSFNALQKTFSVWKSGAWRAIASKDDTVNGDTGSTAWHFRDNANTWSLTGIDNNAQSAISKAVEQGTNNQNTSTDVIAITSGNWADTGGFDDGTFDVSCTFWKESPNSFIGLTDLKVNNKKYWFATPIDLSKVTGTIVSSYIDWVLKRDQNNTTYFDSYFTRFKVYAFVTGDTGWTECTRGLPIPGVPVDLVTTGKTLYLKTEFDITDFIEFNIVTEPSLLVEIN